MKKIMGAVKRAFLYMIRKRSKTLLLFAILLVLMTLVMTAVSIGNAAKEAALELRRTLGGYFKLEDNLEYMGQREVITDSLVEHISSIEGIKDSNKMNIQYLITPDLTLEAGMFTSGGDEKAQLARFLGNSDSSLHEYFILRSFRLIEGRHIGPKDRNKVILSKKLADMNGLSIGDSILGVLYFENPDNETKSAVPPYHWEITGIFDVDTEPGSNGLTAECDIADNFIFTDSFSMMKVQTDINAQNAGKYRGAVFFTDDPEQLNKVIQEVREIEGVNWDSFELKVNDKAYRNTVFPLNRLGSYTTMFLLVIVAISIILLSLILTMWMRDRLQEIGIFLSIGIRKISLAGQHLLEVLVILIFALIIAFPISNMIADYAGNSFLENMPEEEMVREENNRELFYNPVDLSEMKDAGTVRVSVSTGEFLFAALYGASVSLIATGLSSILMIRIKPKDILSMMS